MADQQIVIDIVTRLDKLEKDLNRAGQKTQKFGQSVKKLGMVFAGVTAGVFALTKGITSLIKAYANQEKEEKLLARAIQNRVGSLEEAGAATEQLLKFAKERQHVTAFGDEATIAAMKIGATFPLTVDQIKELTIRAQDYAAATGKDLTAAMADLGRATEGQYGMLTRYGVSISDATKETGDFNSLLKDLDSNFGGFAETMATTVEGRWKQLNNLIGDAKERLGAALLPALESIRPILERLPQLMDRLTPAITKIVEGLTPIAETLFELVEVLLPALMPILEGVSYIFEGINAVLKTFVGWIKEAITGVEDLIAISKSTTSPEEKKLRERRMFLQQQLSWTTAAPLFLTKEQRQAYRDELRVIEAKLGGYLAPSVSGEAEGTISEFAPPPLGTPSTGKGKAGETEAEKRRRKYLEEAQRLRDMDSDLAIEQQIATQNRIIELEAAAARESIRIQEQKWQTLESNLRTSMGIVADLIKTGFVEGATGAWEAIKDLAAKVATSALIQLATKLIMTILAPGSTMGQMGWGKVLLQGVMGGLGLQGMFDNPANDAWVRRQGTDFIREFALGLRQQMMPTFAGIGGTQIIEVPAGLTPFIKVYRNSPEADKQAFGRVNRESTAISKRGEI